MNPGSGLRLQDRHAENPRTPRQGADRRSARNSTSRKFHNVSCRPAMSRSPCWSRSSTTGSCRKSPRADWPCDLRRARHHSLRNTTGQRLLADAGKTSRRFHRRYRPSARASKGGRVDILHGNANGIGPGHFVRAEHDSLYQILADQLPEQAVQGRPRHEPDNRADVHMQLRVHWTSWPAPPGGRALRHASYKAASSGVWTTRLQGAVDCRIGGGTSGSPRS